MSSPTPVAGIATQSGDAKFTTKHLEALKSAISRFIGAVNSKGKGGDTHAFTDAFDAFSVIRENPDLMPSMDIDDLVNDIRTINDKGAIDRGARILAYAMSAAINLSLSLEEGLEVLNYAKKVLTADTATHWLNLVESKNLVGLREWYDAKVEADADKSAEDKEHRASPAGMSEALVKEFNFWMKQGKTPAQFAEAINASVKNYVPRS